MPGKREIYSIYTVSIFPGEHHWAIHISTSPTFFILEEFADVCRSVRDVICVLVVNIMRCKPVVRHKGKIEYGYLLQQLSLNAQPIKI